MVDNGNGRHAQVLRGMLDMCVLALVCQQPSYGYGLLQRLAAKGLPAGSEASVYLVLKRLKQHGLVQSELDDSYGGPARKVYHPTDEGRAALVDWITEWCEVKRGVEAIVGPCPPGKAEE